MSDKCREDRPPVLPVSPQQDAEMRNERQFAAFTGLVVAIAAAGAQPMQVDARPSTQGVAPPMHPAMGGGFESGLKYCEEPERDQGGSNAHSYRSTNHVHMNETHTADNEKTTEGVEGDGQKYENTRGSARPDHGAHESSTAPAGEREMLPPPSIDRHNDYHTITPGDGTQEAWAARTIDASGISPRRATACIWNATCLHETAGITLPAMCQAVAQMCYVYAQEGDSDALNAMLYFESDLNEDAPRGTQEQRENCTKYMLRALALWRGSLRITIDRGGAQTSVHIEDPKGEGRPATQAYISRLPHPQTHDPLCVPDAARASDQTTQSRTQDHTHDHAQKPTAADQQAPAPKYCTICRDSARFSAAMVTDDYSYDTWAGLRAHTLEAHPQLIQCPFCGTNAQCQPDEPACLMHHWCTTNCADEAYKNHVATKRADPDADTAWKSMREQPTHVQFNPMTQAKMDALSEMTTEPAPTIDESKPMWSGRPYMDGGQVQSPAWQILQNDRPSQLAVEAAHKHAMRKSRTGGMHKRKHMTPESKQADDQRKTVGGLYGRSEATRFTRGFTPPPSQSPASSPERGAPTPETPGPAITAQDMDQDEASDEQKTDATASMRKDSTATPTRGDTDVTEIAGGGGTPVMDPTPPRSTHAAKPTRGRHP